MDKLKDFYLWAFDECDRIDKVPDKKNALRDLMHVIKRVDGAIAHTDLAERTDAMEKAMEELS